MELDISDAGFAPAMLQQLDRIKAACGVPTALVMVVWLGHTDVFNAARRGGASGEALEKLRVTLAYLDTLIAESLLGKDADGNALHNLFTGLWHTNRLESAQAAEGVH